MNLHISSYVHEAFKKQETIVITFSTGWGGKRDDTITILIQRYNICLTKLPAKQYGFDKFTPMHALSGRRNRPYREIIEVIYFWISYIFKMYS